MSEHYVGNKLLLTEFAYGCFTALTISHSFSARRR